MRRIVHLSDLHFGWNESKLVKSLSALVTDARPDLTVFSGDFVEHATRAEFQQARAFIQALPEPMLMVPGNHDLPFYNYPRRVRQGLRLYREYITGDLTPFYADEEVAVLGLNTARLWPIRGGSISAEQVREVEARLCPVRGGVVRILVTHHPFDLPQQYGARSLVKHGRAALTRLACCLDVLLAGHMHIGASGRVADRFQTPNGSLVFAQAGTAISKRYKGERNSFNVIEIDGRLIRIRKYSWDADQSAYEATIGEIFEFTAGS
ncbi:MAG: metallophosphoesterase [Bryobacterales bacterium]|nr:metallophosphoesterase [Bryobacterales bacterium]